MTAPTVILIFAGVLFFLLLYIVSREDAGNQESSESDLQSSADSRYSLQPPGLVLRIFSQEDRQFISRTGSKRLRQLYEVERKRVALHWVRRTSREVSKIMLNHRLATRQSPNLDVAKEAKLLFKHLELRFICGLLIALIAIFGPHVLGDLAAYAGELYQSIGRAVPEAAFANASTSSGNLGTR